MIATGPDLLRLVLVPAFIWLALHDIRTRRVPRWVWYPLAAIGALALAWDGIRHLSTGTPWRQIWLIRVGISLGLIAPLGYLFHRVGAFGAADAKAMIVIAIAFPTFPVLTVSSTTFPLVESPLGVFSLTVLVNAVLLGLFYPLSLAVRNAVAGRFRLAMLIGIPVHWSSLEDRHGVLLEHPDGFTRQGLDLDALRMYLRWRDTDLETLRSSVGDHAAPSSVRFSPGMPGDGRVRRDGGIDEDDRWGARAFLDAAEGAYGTRPDTLRAGLDVLCERETLWISPGIPFLVLLAGGLLVGLLVGDVFTPIATWIGM